MTTNNSFSKSEWEDLVVQSKRHCIKDIAKQYGIAEELVTQEMIDLHVEIVFQDMFLRSKIREAKQ